MNSLMKTVCRELRVVPANFDDWRRPVDRSLEIEVARYFDKFEFFGGTPGTALSPKSTIELETGTENQALTVKFENDPALLFMKKQGWVSMPGGRLAVLTKLGSEELSRRGGHVAIVT